MFRRNFQRVAVLGLGYIGLPTAAVIASRGMKVIGIDTNDQVRKRSKNQVQFISKSRI